MYICPTKTTSISLISSHYPERGISLISSHYDHEYLSYFSQLSYSHTIRGICLITSHFAEWGISLISSHYDQEYLSHFYSPRSRVRYHSQSFPPTTITSIPLFLYHYDHEWGITPNHFLSLRSRVSPSFLPTTITSEVSLSIISPHSLRSRVSLISYHYGNEWGISHIYSPWSRVRYRSQCVVS